MRKGHPWDDLIFRALRHAWLFDAYCRPQPQFNFKQKIRGELQHRHVIVHLLL